jgi:hypothetical protein
MNPSINSSIAASLPLIHAASAAELGTVDVRALLLLLLFTLLLLVLLLATTALARGTGGIGLL